MVLSVKYATIYFLLYLNFKVVVIVTSWTYMYAMGSFLRCYYCVLNVTKLVKADSLYY